MSSFIAVKLDNNSRPDAWLCPNICKKNGCLFLTPKGHSARQVLDSPPLPRQMLDELRVNLAVTIDPSPDP
jgi:hypothetical protein